MQFQELFGFGLVVAFVVGLGLFVSSMRLPRALKRLIYAALALRVLGACARYLVLFEVYRGAGDARGYYGRGLAYAQRFWSLDFSPFYDPRLWFRGTWTETSFISFPSGIILGMIGPSLLGEFVAFSMLAFVGLAGFAIALSAPSAARCRPVYPKSTAKIPQVAQDSST